MCEVESTKKPGAFTPPKRTWLGLLKFVPVMSTRLVPSVEPASGDTLVTVGGAAEVKLLPLTAVETTFVTVMFTMPVPAGDTAVICVAELRVNDAAGVEPHATLSGPEKWEPVMTTVVPPACGPVVTSIPEIVGAPT